MKTSEEMVNSLMKRKELYDIQQKNRKKYMIKVISVMGIILLCIGISNKELIKDFFITQETIKDDIHQENKEDVVNDEVIIPTQDIEVENDLIREDVLGNIIYNGENYRQISVDMSGYTLDTCLGKASDYSGTYQTSLKDIAGKLYTVKEDSNILIVTLLNDGIVVLRKE